jgi:hypothetical protein
LFNFITMKKARKLKGAEAIGMKVKVSKSLEKFSGKVLFPEKLEKANNIISRLKMN